MDQQIINLFDEYTHTRLSREEFIRRLARLTGSTAAALAMLPLLEVNYAHAAQTDGDGLVTESITYPGENGTMKGYLARPRDSRKAAAVIVIHENRGLNPHIEDVTRRVAKAGFLALAPDALSGKGGTPADADQARALFQELNAEQNLKNFLRAIDYLKARPESNGKTGCVGFCWGGAMANELAVHAPALQAAVAYYGRQPKAEDVHKIKAAVLLHYAEMDERINAGIESYEAALQANGIRYELYRYAGAQHAFNNDTAPTRYNEAAARLAWSRTLDFLHRYLR